MCARTQSKHTNHYAKHPIVDIQFSEYHIRTNIEIPNHVPRPNMTSTHSGSFQYDKPQIEFEDN